MLAKGAGVIIITDATWSHEAHVRPFKENW
jgi:hypothetical protein